MARAATPQRTTCCSNSPLPSACPPTRARDVLASRQFADEVREAERFWQEAGIDGVPAVVINRRHLIQGGQPPEVFEQALRKIAAEDRHERLARTSFAVPARRATLTTLLEVDDLRVTLATARGPAEALRGVSFTLAARRYARLDRRVRLRQVDDRAGADGSAARGCESRRLDPSRRPRAGRRSTTPRCARLRGDRIGMVFQEPMTALNPLHTIGRQIAEPLRLHRGLRRSGRARRSAAPARARAAAATRRGAWTPTRTSSRAGSASAWSSPSRWPAAPTC